MKFFGTHYFSKKTSAAKVVAAIHCFFNDEKPKLLEGFVKHSDVGAFFVNTFKTHYPAISDTSAPHYIFEAGENFWRVLLFRVSSLLFIIFAVLMPMMASLSSILIQHELPSQILTILLLFIFLLTVFLCFPFKIIKKVEVDFEKGTISVDYLNLIKKEKTYKIELKEFGYKYAVRAEKNLLYNVMKFYKAGKRKFYISSRYDETLCKSLSKMFSVFKAREIKEK